MTETTWTAKSMSVQMGFDALRACLGGKPHVFTIKQIIQWLTEIEAAA